MARPSGSDWLIRIQTYLPKLFNKSGVRPDFVMCLLICIAFTIVAHWAASIVSSGMEWMACVSIRLVCILYVNKFIHTFMQGGWESGTIVPDV